MLAIELRGEKVPEEIIYLLSGQLSGDGTTNGGYVYPMHSAEPADLLVTQLWEKG